MEGSALDPAVLRRRYAADGYVVVPGVLSAEEIDGYRAGKAFMLRHAPPWYGIKYLDDDEHNRVAEASRCETFARLPDKIDGAPGDLAVR